VRDLFGYTVRFWRRDWSGRNPLVRASDRFEAALLITVVTAMALALPLAAIVGQSTYAGQASNAAREALSRHRATAIVLQDTPGPIALSEGVGAITTTTTASARWPSPDGVMRTGDISMPSGSRAGERVSIWISATGEQVAAPVPSSGAVTAGVLAGALTLLGAAALFLSVYGGGRKILDRQRLARWERDWAALAGHREMS
jgi:hypothetical protein